MKAKLCDEYLLDFPAVLGSAAGRGPAGGSGSAGDAGSACDPGVGVGGFGSREDSFLWAERLLEADNEEEREEDI